MSQIPDGYYERMKREHAAAIASQKEPTEAEKLAALLDYRKAPIAPNIAPAKAANVAAIYGPALRFLQQQQAAAQGARSGYEQDMKDFQAYLSREADKSGKFLSREYGRIAKDANAGRRAVAGQAVQAAGQASAAMGNSADQAAGSGYATAQAQEGARTQIDRNMVSSNALNRRVLTDQIGQRRNQNSLRVDDLRRAAADAFYQQLAQQAASGSQLQSEMAQARINEQNRVSDINRQAAQQAFQNKMALTELADSRTKTKADYVTSLAAANAKANKPTTGGRSPNIILNDSYTGALANYGMQPQDTREIDDPEKIRGIAAWVINDYWRDRPDATPEEVAAAVLPFLQSRISSPDARPIISEVIAQTAGG